MAHDGLRERLLSTKPEQPGWWMVERDDGKTRPLYLTQPGGAGGWSSDWRDGFKFTNREDAEQQFELWHSAYGHVRSHSMMVEFVNPDGPEAVATIERLTEALEATRPPIVTDELVERPDVVKALWAIFMRIDTMPKSNKNMGLDVWTIKTLQLVRETIDLAALPTIDQDGGEG